MRSLHATTHGIRMTYSHERALMVSFVLHPDPWPKTRHVKNRPISRWFLELAEDYLPGGTLRIKSDFAPNVARVFELVAHGRRGESSANTRLTHYSA